MKLFTLLQTKFYQFDSAIKSYLSQTLSKYSTSYGNNTIFGQFMNVLNGVVQNIMLYIEDSLVEQNKYTAQRKKSIYGLAALSGYNPDFGKAAGVQLSLNFVPSNNNGIDVLINNYEQLTCTQNGLPYCLIIPQETIIMSASNNVPKQIYAVQGRINKQRFISTGGKYYTQTISFSSNVDTDYITVNVNGEKWSKVASLYDMMPDGKEWTFKINPIKGIDIVFGNGRYGRPLNNSDVIEISYLAHDGAAGNLNVDENTYFLFDNSLSDVTGNEVDGNNLFNITFASNDPVTAGSNSESTEQVRNMIGFNSRSLVLASPENYKQFLSRFSFCGYNRTWVEKGSLVVNSLIMRNYKMLLNENKTYFDLREDEFKLTETQKSSLINCIEKSGNQLAGSTYNIFEPELCKYAMYIYLKMKDKEYEKISINLMVRKLIAEFFGDIQSDQFIPKSDIIQLLKNNIPEIDGVNVYFLSEINELAKQKGYYTINEYKYEISTGKYIKDSKDVYLYPNEDPNLGLDKHGNILLKSDFQFPVLMGGWDYINTNGDEVVITDPLNIIYD